MSRINVDALHSEDGGSSNIELDDSRNTTCKGNLTVDGNIAVTGTGLTDTLSFRNMFINGSMQVAQRSSSVSITGDGSSQDAYRTVDRWFHNSRNDSNWTYTKENDGPAGFANSLKVACTGTDSSIAGNVYKYVGQRIEGQNLQQLQKGTATAKSFTVSFWVKSNLPGTYVVEARDYDTPRICCKTYTVPANENWNKFSVTFPGDTTGAMDNDNNTSLEINFWLAVGADKSAGTLPATWETKDEADRAVGQVSGMLTSGKYWQMTGAQMELGDTATEFEHRPYSYELARCQRYLQKWGNDGKYFAPGCTDSTTYGRWGVDLACPLRASPTVKTGGSEIRLYRDGDNKNSTNTPTVLKFTPNSTQIALAVDGYTSLTSQRIATFVFNGDNKNIYFSGDDTNLALEAEL